MTEPQDRAKEQAQAQLESISEMMQALATAREEGEATFFDEVISEDDIMERISEDPLDIEVRSDWHTEGDAEGNEAGEYNILLCTGGPACRIFGRIGDYAQPDTAELQYQDWGTPWTTYYIADDALRGDLLDYANHVWYG